MSQSQDLAFRVQLLEEQVEELTRRLTELSLARAPTSLGSYQVVSRPLSPRSEVSSAGGRSVSTSGEYNALAAPDPGGAQGEGWNPFYKDGSPGYEPFTCDSWRASRQSSFGGPGAVEGINQPGVGDAGRPFMPRACLMALRLEVLKAERSCKRSLQGAQEDFSFRLPRMLTRGCGQLRSFPKVFQI